MTYIRKNEIGYSDAKFCFRIEMEAWITALYPSRQQGTSLKDIKSKQEYHKTVKVRMKNSKSLITFRPLKIVYSKVCRSNRRKRF